MENEESQHNERRTDLWLNKSEQTQGRSRSRSRNKKLQLVIHLEKKEEDSKERIRLKRSGLTQNKERPDKYMLKKIFTPLKKILENPELRKLGIDLTEYFKARPNPKGGHRTPADIELLLWFVEQKYLEPSAYRTFVSYLLLHRTELEEYGRKSYIGRQRWQEEYLHFVNFIFEVMKTEGDSDRRYRLMFTHKPS